MNYPFGRRHKAAHEDVQIQFSKSHVCIDWGWNSCLVLPLNKDGNVWNVIKEFIKDSNRIVIATELYTGEMF